MMERREKVRITHFSSDFYHFFSVTHGGWSGIEHPLSVAELMNEAESLYSVKAVSFSSLFCLSLPFPLTLLAGEHEAL